MLKMLKIGEMDGIGFQWFQNLVKQTFYGILSMCHVRAAWEIMER